MASHDISSFMSWFLGQIYSMFTQIFGILDSIILAPGVTLLEFIITIFILSIVVGILIAQPGNAMRVEKGVEARDRAKARMEKRKGKGK